MEFVNIPFIYFISDRLVILKIAVWLKILLLLYHDFKNATFVNKKKINNNYVSYYFIYRNKENKIIYHSSVASKLILN